VIDTPKTEKSVRKIPLSELAVQMLEDWKPHALRQGVDDFIFCKPNGQPKDPNQINGSVLPRLRVHNRAL
jgi:hypothetical protein